MNDRIPPEGFSPNSLQNRIFVISVGDRRAKLAIHCKGRARVDFVVCFRL